jgi:hypothetical protein
LQAVSCSCFHQQFIRPSFKWILARIVLGQLKGFRAIGPWYLWAISMVHWSTAIFARYVHVISAWTFRHYSSTLCPTLKGPYQTYVWVAPHFVDRGFERESLLDVSWDRRLLSTSSIVAIWGTSVMTLSWMTSFRSLGGYPKYTQKHSLLFCPSPAWSYYITDTPLGHRLWWIHFWYLFLQAHHTCLIVRWLGYPFTAFTLKVRLVESSLDGHRKDIFFHPLHLCASSKQTLDELI